ncbi:protein of unknown function [Xenorhabdus doucetiae]|uniref:Uncharacterized protein n=1 Tax=Xenorhabdus doucetiae TaxID=351671 RepID=A0A068QSY4_9GAMM|nr:protein of unknown function [Xenorhabdus doucetiae]
MQVIIRTKLKVSVKFALIGKKSAKESLSNWNRVKQTVRARPSVFS